MILFGKKVNEIGTINIAYLLIFTFILLLPYRANGEQMNNMSKMESLIESVKNNPEVMKIAGENLTQSFPIPIISKEKTLISFLYFTKFGLPPSPPQIYPPKYKVLADYESGDVLDIQHLPSNDFFLNAQMDKSLGEHKLDSHITLTIFMEKRKELYFLYDKIIPLFKSNTTNVFPENKKLVGNFYTLFHELAEKPLFEYYKMLNPQFYDWISRYSN